MNDIMSVRRSCEAGRFLLREGDCVWRTDKDGKVDCTASGPSTMFELLNFLQTCKNPPLRLFQEFPLQD